MQRNGGKYIGNLDRIMNGVNICSLPFEGFVGGL
jgi:hypothetical protein